MKCDIVMPIWNQAEFTKDCIEHILKNTGYPYSLILIDNGSGIPAREYLESLKRDSPAELTLIRNETNLGFVKAVNQGLKASTAPYVCIMNNDTLPAPGWLERMVEVAEAHRDIGLVNPLCDSDPGMSLEEHARRARKDSGKYLEVNQCYLFATLIKREVIDRIGYLDEAFGMGYWEDADYARRALAAGYRCARADASYVHHVHGVSFKAMGNRDALVAHGEKQYLKKWPRPVRIGMTFSLDSNTSQNEIRNMLKTVLFLVRQWCWVSLWILGENSAAMARIKIASKEIGMPAHQNIKFTFLSRFKYIGTLARILERSFGTKKRKKYDAVLVNDSRVYSFLNILHPVHRARVHLVDLNEDITKDLNKIYAL